MFWLWAGFILLVLLMLALDLGVFHRHAHVVRVREALGWSAFWIALSLLFNVFVYFAYERHWGGLGLAPSRLHPEGLDGRAAAILFFTGYVVEKSLSVDNIFVIALVFGYFGIPAKYQHRVLFWGIIGALVMRGAMIGLGAALIARFHWILYIFGAFLIFTAFRMLFGGGDPDPENNALTRFARRLFPITRELHGQRLVVRAAAAEAMGEGASMEHRGDTLHDRGDAPPPPAGGGGRWMLTPLALALVVVEGTDLVFAVDSIPAIFAITTDPFLVFTSNVCAILGLRALYFALAGVLDKFHYLKVSLAVVLGVVGAKMLVADYLKRYEWFQENLSFLTLGMIALVLGTGVVASLIRARRMPVGPETVPPVEGSPKPGAAE